MNFRSIFANMKGIDIIYEDNHLIAINKNAGSLSQGDITGDIPVSESVKKYIKHKYQKPGNVFLGTIHRLDRPTTGVLVFARTSKALSRMNALFSNNGVEKTYFMLSHKRTEDLKGKLVHHILKNNQKNTSQIVSAQRRGAKKAILHYQLLNGVENKYLYKIKLETGRSHQIRCQMAYVGCPILGDLRYGATKALPDKSIALHCAEIRFTHPVSKEVIRIKAKLPKLAVWNPFRQIKS